MDMSSSNIMTSNTTGNSNSITISGIEFKLGDTVQIVNRTDRQWNSAGDSTLAYPNDKLDNLGIGAVGKVIHIYNSQYPSGDCIGIEIAGEKYGFWPHNIALKHYQEEIATKPKFNIGDKVNVIANVENGESYQKSFSGAISTGTGYKDKVIVEREYSEYIKSWIYRIYITPEYIHGNWILENALKPVIEEKNVEEPTPLDSGKFKMYDRVYLKDSNERGYFVAYISDYSCIIELEDSYNWSRNDCIPKEYIPKGKNQYRYLSPEKRVLVERYFPDKSPVDTKFKMYDKVEFDLGNQTMQGFYVKSPYEGCDIIEFTKNYGYRGWKRDNNKDNVPDNYAPQASDRYFGVFKSNNLRKVSSKVNHWEPSVPVINIPEITPNLTTFGEDKTNKLQVEEPQIIVPIKTTTNANLIKKMPIFVE